MNRLALILALLLSGCASHQPLEPLPHYPCRKDEAGKRVVYSCSADEWLTQVILRESVYD